MSLIGHYYMSRPELPPLQEAQSLEYWTASNGVFVRAHREGIEAVIPVILRSLPIPGLFPLTTHITMEYPLVPLTMVMELLAESWKARDPQTNAPLEALFHLRWQDGAWRWSKPDQDQQSTSVTPTAPYEPSLPVPLIDLHSHHVMAPFFSDTDTRDEQGYRFYAVWGHLDSSPTLLVRLGIYGHFLPLPASRVFELPSFLRDGFSGVALHALGDGWLL